LLHEFNQPLGPERFVEKGARAGRKNPLPQKRVARPVITTTGVLSFATLLRCDRTSDPDNPGSSTSRIRHPN
jgi:hypothetical protein